MLRRGTRQCSILYQGKMDKDKIRTDINIDAQSDVYRGLLGAMIGVTVQLSIVRKNWYNKPQGNRAGGRFMRPSVLYPCF